MSNTLPVGIQEKVSSMPESSYGANRVTVILDDGTRIPHVHIAWGKEVVKVGTSQSIYFDVNRIVDVESEV